VSSPQPAGYRAFVVRLWRTDGRKARSIRISVQDIHSKEGRLFSNVDALSEYLMEKARELTHTTGTSRCMSPD